MGWRPSEEGPEAWLLGAVGGRTPRGEEAGVVRQRGLLASERAVPSLGPTLGAARKRGGEPGAKSPEQLVLRRAPERQGAGPAVGSSAAQTPAGPGERVVSGMGLRGPQTQTRGRKTRGPGRKKGLERESPSRTWGPAVARSPRCPRPGNPHIITLRTQTRVQFSAEGEWGGKEC